MCSPRNSAPQTSQVMPSTRAVLYLMLCMHFLMFRIYAGRWSAACVVRADSRLAHICSNERGPCCSKGMSSCSRGL